MGRIKIKKIKLNSNKISNKIVLISDTHYSSKKDLIKLNNILDQIKKLNPNYICVLGDICDQAKIFDEEVLIDWFSKLALISKVIVVYGNHDLSNYKKKTSCLNEQFFNRIKSINNVELLDNQSKCIDNICFVGLKFDYNYYYKYGENYKKFIKLYNEVVQELNNNNYNILLTHSPIALTQDGVINKLNDYKNIDLVLSGHMHGGLMPDFLRPIFKTRGLVGPNKHRLFVKYAYGNFKIENINFMVSSGVTKLSNVSKLNFFDKLYSPEIVEIEINNNDNFDNENKNVLK